MMWVAFVIDYIGALLCNLQIISQNYLAVNKSLAFFVNVETP